MDFMFSYSNLTVFVLTFNIFVMVDHILFHKGQISKINEKIEDLTNKNELLVKENEEIRKKLEENNIKYDNKNNLRTFDLFDNVYVCREEYEKKIECLENNEQTNIEYYDNKIKLLENKIGKPITEETYIENNIEYIEKRIHKIEKYVMQIKKLLVNSDISPNCYDEVNSYNNFFEAFEEIDAFENIYNEP